MRFILRAFVTTLLLSVVIVIPARGQKQGLIPEDYYHMTFVSDAAISPPGDLVAFTVTTVLEEDNRRHREVWLQRVENGRPMGDPFRFTDPSRESSSPVWSPDGKVLSFQSHRDDDRSTTRFARVTAPGGEAYTIEGVEGAPMWSPDSSLVAFTWTGENEESGDESKRRGWIAPDAISRTLDPDRMDGRVITSMRYKRDGTLELLPHPDTKPRKQIYVVAAEGGTPRRLTDLSFDVRDVDWSGDGRLFFFWGDERGDEPKLEATRDLYAVSADGGEVKRLTTNPGSEYAPVVSPDGKRLAYLHSDGRGSPTDLVVVEIGADGSFTGEAHNLTPDWDLDPGSPRWASSDTIRFEASIGGNRHLFEVPSGGGQVRQVTTGERRLSSFAFSKDDKLMAYIATNPVSPAEVFVSAGDGSGEHRISSFNDSWLSDVELMPAERLTYTVSGGPTVEGWVIKPVGYQPDRKYPMVLKIHGGPRGAYGNTFFQTFQVLSGAGFFVLYVNPRGGSAYGTEFASSIEGKMYFNEDWLEGVDAAVAKYPAIDPKRVGVSGGSYGGIATNWLTATTDRFAAAVTSRSYANMESFWGTTDIPDFAEYYMGGLPWEKRDVYRELSPFSHVENVTAPTLIIHSEQDYRCPIPDAEQWFMALKKLGTPVEFVRYPRSSHGLSRRGEPWLLVDRLERLRSWFVYWLIENPT